MDIAVDKDEISAFFFISMILMAILLTTGCTQEEGVQETPKNTFKEYVKRVNNREGEEALELTDAELLKDNESLSGTIDEVENTIDEGRMKLPGVEIVEVAYREDMTEKNKSRMKNLTNWYDGEGLEVSNDCFIRVNIPTQNGTQELTFPMIKVDGKWYIGWIGHIVVITGRVLPR